MADPPTGLRSPEPLEEEVGPGSPARCHGLLSQSQHRGSILTLTCYLPTLLWARMTTLPCPPSDPPFPPLFFHSSQPSPRPRPSSTTLPLSARSSW